MLAVPDSVREIKKVLVAYDNSIPASKAGHMFLLLGIWNACDITLLTVNSDFNRTPTTESLHSRRTDNY